MKKIISILVICLLSSCANMNTNTATQPLSSAAFAKKNVPQYLSFTIDAQIIAEWQNPHNSQDIAVDLDILTPSGKRAKLPGYYVSGKSEELSHWQFKFTPTEVGTYSIAARVSDDEKTTKWSSKNFTTVKSSGKGFLRANDNWTLKYDNGELFRGLGENFAWESRDNDDSRFFKALHENPRFNYDDMLKSLSESGANIFRTWMIFWNLPVDYNVVDNNSRYKNSSERFNQSGVQRMNELIELSEKSDMKIILSMDSHAGFAGEGWKYNSYNQQNGGPVKSAADFFVNEKAKQRYKDKLRFLVARWSYAPQIAAWEFFNEIDNVMYDGEEQHIADEVITAWHKEMSDYLATIDAHNHLTTTSISHRSVKGLFNLQNIDINQTHLYKVTDNIPSIIRTQTELFDNPYFVGEFSAEWDWSKNFDLIQDTMISDYKRGLWYGIFSPSPIMPLSWWWEYFDEKGTSSYFNNVKTINDLMLSTSKRALLEQNIENENKMLTTLAVNNGSKIFVYIDNSTTENQTITLNGLSADSTIDSIYDCETGEYIKNFQQGSLSISPSKHWVIIYNL